MAEIALRASFKISELGAVLFGEKPICLEAIEDSSSNVPMNSRFTLLGECHRQFLPIWHRISDENAPFVFIAGNTEGVTLPLWINKRAFLSTVKENLEIFQAILGPLVTPEGLLSEFTTPGVDPFVVLRSNKVLLGILLGFGKENSMLHARMEEIECPSIEREKAPLRFDHLNVVFSIDPPPYFVTWDFPPSLFTPHPVPGYCSLTEEDSILAKCFALSLDHPESKGRAIPLFGCNLLSRETKKLIRRYCVAVDKAERFLESNNFLQKILALLLGVPKVELLITPSSNSFFPDQPSLHRAIASVLVRKAFSDVFPYREGLIAGFREEAMPSIADPFLAYCETEYACLAYQNLVASDQFFSSIDPGWTEVVPQQLYYRILKPGAGTPVSKETKTVLISYSIAPIEGTSSEDHSYEDTCGRDVQHHFAELIPGMSHAIVGMRPHEAREILVHPAHAYGVDSRFEPGVSLRIKVSLRSQRDITEPLSPIAKLSLTLPEIKHDPDECLWALGYAEGAAAWAHLRQASDLIDREEVIKELEAWDPGDEQDIVAFSHLQVELCRRRYGL
ncbi:MAG: hypothetical protein JSR80_04955 [Verrucomicrobia bacterium]|nr:hypothetical protein [Verrucomicrobiota bacterium]